MLKFEAYSTHNLKQIKNQMDDAIDQFMVDLWERTGAGESVSDQIEVKGYLDDGNNAVFPYEDDPIEFTVTAQRYEVPQSWVNGIISVTCNYHIPFAEIKQKYPDTYVGTKYAPEDAGTIITYGLDNLIDDALARCGNDCD